MPIDKELLDLAEEKGVDIFPFLEAGYNPEFLKQVLRAFNPPHGVVGGFIRGLGRGLTGTLGGLVALPELVGVETFKPIREKLTEVTEALAPSPYASLPERVTSILGEIVSFFTPAITGKVVGAVGKAGKVARVLSKGEEAVPFILGASTAGTTYVAQPEERKSAARALITGALQVPLFAIPVSGVAGKIVKELPVLAERPVLRTALAEATALPPVFTSMEAIHRWGVGEEPSKAVSEAVKLLASKEGLAQAIAGGILGGIRGVAERRAEAKHIDELLKKEVETPREEVRPIVEELQKQQETKPVLLEEKPVEETKKEEEKKVSEPIENVSEKVSDIPISDLFRQESTALLHRYFEKFGDWDVDTLEGLRVSQSFPSKDWLRNMAFNYALKKIGKKFEELTDEECQVLEKYMSEFFNSIKKDFKPIIKTLVTDIENSFNFLISNLDDFNKQSLEDRVRYLLVLRKLISKSLDRKAVSKYLGENRAKLENYLSEIDSLLQGLFIDELTSYSDKKYGKADLSEISQLASDILNVIKRDNILIRRGKSKPVSVIDVLNLLDNSKSLLDMHADFSSVAEYIKEKVEEKAEETSLPPESMEGSAEPKVVSFVVKPKIVSKKGETTNLSHSLWKSYLKALNKEDLNRKLKYAYTYEIIDDIPNITPEVMENLKQSFEKVRNLSATEFLPMKEGIAEKDLVKLFLDEPYVRSVIDGYISSTLGDALTVILRDIREATPEEVSSQLGTALTKLQYKGKSYIEALFGKEIGSRLEVNLNKWRKGELSKKSKYTDADMKLLDYIQKYPKEFFLKITPEVVEHLYSLVRKAITLEDIYNILLEGSLEKDVSGLDYASDALGVGLSKVFNLLGKWQKRWEENRKKTTLYEVIKTLYDTIKGVEEVDASSYVYTSADFYKLLMDLVLKHSGYKFDVEKFFDDLEAGKSWAGSLKQELLSKTLQDKIQVKKEDGSIEEKSLLQVLIDSFKDISQKINKEIERIKKDEDSKAIFKKKALGSLFAEQLHAFLLILRKLPFKVPDVSDKFKPYYDRILFWENEFHRKFLEKFNIKEVYDKVLDTYVKFVTMMRTYREEKYREQAFNDIRRRLDDLLRESLNQDNPYSIVPDIRFLPRNLENINEYPDGYVILSFSETGDKKLSRALSVFKDVFKSGVPPFERLLIDRFDNIVVNGRRFLIFDAKEFFDYLSGRIDKPTLLDKSFRDVYSDYIKAVFGKKEYFRIKTNTTIYKFVKLIDDRIIRSEKELSKFPDISHFFRRPKDYLKVKFYEAVEKQYIDLPPIDIHFRSVLMAERDPYVLKNPIKMFQFMKSVLAKALGEEIGIFVGHEYDPIVSYLRKVLGTQFSGFAINLGEKKYLGIVFGEHTNEIITFGHELFHLIEPFLPETDRNLLYSKFKNTEEIAEAFGRYVFKKYEPPSFLKRVFDKMLSVIEKIKSFLRGMGFVSAQDIFDRILAGEYARTYDKPENIPTPYFMDAWEIARIVRKDFSNKDFHIAFRTKVLSEMEDRVKEIFNNIVEERIPYSVRRFITGISHGKIELVSKEEAAMRVAGFIPRTRNPIIRFVRDNLIAPLYHPVLKIFHHYYKEANKEVIERTIRVFQKADRTLETLKKDNSKLYDKLRDIVFYSDAEGRYLVDFETEVSFLHPDLSPREISVLKDAYDKIKNLFDTFFIEKFRETFLTGFNTLERALDSYVKRGFITNELKLEIMKYLWKVRDEALDKLFRLYEFEVRDGKRVPINDMRKEPRELWKQYKKEIKNFLSIIEKGDEVFNTIDVFMKSLDYATKRIRELDNGFYIPRVRYNGNYELRVFAKYVDENGNTRYAEIEYWDTDRNHSDYVQKNQLYKLYKDISKRLEGSLEVFSTDEWHQSGKSLSEFLSSALGKNEPDYVIVMGRKPPKSETTIDKLSPSEAFDFLKSLVFKVDNPEALKTLETTFMQAVYALYADTSYALARRLYRRRLPKELSQKVIEGYRKELQEIIRDYYLRMSGHLSNSIFMNYYFEQIEKNPEVERLFLTEPKTKELCNKYMDMLTAPHSPLAQFVYKFRALTAFYYLALRVSSMIMNLTNLATTFLPEYAYVKAISSFEVMRQLSPEVVGWEALERKDWKTSFKEAPSSVVDILKAVGDLKRYIQNGFIKPDLSEVNFEKVREAISKKKATELDLKILETIQDLIDYGVIESSFYRTIREEGMNLFGRGMKAIFDYGMIGFRYTEAYGRLIASISMAKHLYDKKGFISRSTVSQLTRIIIDKTFGDYSRANRPYWTNPRDPFGAIMSLPTTLKGFIMNLFSLYAEWVGKKEFDKLALSMTMFFIFGGLAGLPWMDDLVDILERITKKPLRMTVYNGLKKTIGKTFADFIVKGVPYAFHFIDFSTPLKVELPLPHGTSFDALADVFLGVYKNVYERALKGGDLLLDGEVLAGLSFLLPMGLSMPIQASLLTTKGLRTKYGKQIIEMETGEPFELTPEEAFLRALGFRPYRLAEIQDKRYFGARIASIFEDWRNSIYRRWRNSSSPEDYKKLAEEIIEFNRKALEYRGLISPITGATIRRAIKPRVEKLTQIAELAHL